MPLIARDSSPQKPFGLTDTIPFGKYKGALVGSILQSDPGYLVWAHENEEFVGWFKLTNEVYREANDKYMAEARYTMDSSWGDIDWGDLQQ